MTDYFHNQTEQEVLKYFKTSIQKGLEETSIPALQQKYGPNELPQEEPTSLLSRILAQFEDLLVRILLCAAIVSFILAFAGGAEEEGVTAFVEPFVILMILIANATIGVWQETNAEQALAALKSLQPEICKVHRSGKSYQLAAKELVPGDIVFITQGDKAPADIRLVQLNTTTLRINQSILTGEAQDVNKITKGVDVENPVIQDLKNYVFSGTTVSSGSAIGVVTQIGIKTQIGQIQQQVQQAAGEEEATPIKQKLDEFGNLLSKVIGVICLLVWAMNFGHFFDEIHGGFVKGCIYYFKIAVALAVAAIPEGLPAVITTCLALGTRKMAKKNAIVRKLPSVETLGCTTVICSDKTGTLTTNEMTVTEIIYAGKTQFEIFRHNIQGHSFEPIGQIENFSKEQFQQCTNIKKLASVASVCNEASILIKNGIHTSSGMPTEAALKVMVEKIGQYESKEQFQKQEADPIPYNTFLNSKYQKFATLEFTRDRKAMSIIVKHQNQETNELFIKGAPEGILDKCNRVLLSDGTIQPISAQLKQNINKYTQDMSKSALRCLAFAYKDDNAIFKSYNGPNHAAHSQLEDTSKFSEFEKDSIFIGLCGMRDPPRPEVASSIAICKNAGIRVIMITGDNQHTAEAIGKQVGILTAGENSKSYTGQELDSMSDQEIKAILKSKDGQAFSRTEPRHKRKIVQLLLEENEIVAMTGDGVNDAPALKQASIGIAMGITGTEVAKEASDMILADDNFATIVVAVEEGRSIFSNTKAFIRYLISSNIGEVASIFFTAMLGIPEGLTSVQLLWVNLVTDGLPATALGFNPPDLDIMKKPPRKADEPIISGWVFVRYMIIGLYVGVATVGIFIYWFTSYESADGHTLLSFEQLSNFSKCPTWENFIVNNFDHYDFSKNPCLYFTIGKRKAMTLSLSVLVVIEMLNSLNAISEDGSLVQMPPWVNTWLLLAISGSLLSHAIILYVPFLAQTFGVVSLTWDEWVLVVAWSIPVIFIDEILKALTRYKNERNLKDQLKKAD